MKRMTVLAVLVLTCLLVLAGCKCEHEWIEADCDTPRTCVKCELTEGEPTPHVWEDATCTVAKTCTLCNVTEGEPAGHAWLDANCQQPQTCEACGITQGGLGDHVWLPATTEEPQTCSLCAVTEGEKINTDPRFTTAATEKLYGVWGCEYTFSGQDLGIGEVVDQIPATLYCKFERDGVFRTSVKVKDEAAYLEVLRQINTDFVYDTYAAMEMDKDAAAADILELYGMSVEEYVQSLTEKNADALFDMLFDDGVYYVDQGQYWFAKSWNGEFVSGDYTVTEEELVISTLTITDDGQPLTWTKLS